MRRDASMSIVAATDFTPAAGMAARRAAMIAAARGGRVELLHVTSPAGKLLAPLFGVLGGRRPSAAVPARLRLVAAQLTAEFGLPVEPRLVDGRAVSGIAAHAERSAPDLVVVGNAEPHLLRDLLLNTAYRVRRSTRMPVLAVSRPAHRAYARMLLATDLSPESARAGRMARELFPGAALHVVHAAQSPYEGSLRVGGVGDGVVAGYRGHALAAAWLALERFARESDLGESVLHVAYGHPAASIRRQVRDLDADLVVMRPAQSWLARGMAHSVTEQVLADPPCDVLLAG